MKFEVFDSNKFMNDRKVVVYGNDEMAYITTYCLEQLQIPVYKYVNREGPYHPPFRKFINLEELVNLCEKENILILWSVSGTARVEADFLEKSGIDRVYSVRELWESIDFAHSHATENYLRLYKRRSDLFFIEDTIANPDKVYLYSLDAVVTERCSLKCKSCSNLMQYYAHPQNVDIEELKQSIDSMLDKVDQIYDLRILGGEPFMNAEFVKIVDAYKEESKISRISIYSNATIFPKEDILEHLKHPKVWMIMSDYGELSGKLEEWKRWCTENAVYNMISKMDLWQDCGKLERHDYCKEELWDIYGNCECRNIPTLIGNKLYNCPYAAHAANLGAMERREMERDFLLVDEKVTSEEIDDFLYNRDYLEACRYCNGRNFKRARIEPFIQTKQPLVYDRLLDEKEEIISKNQENICKKGCEALLSVVIPVYNVEKYIEKCLTSVLNQTYENLEIIIVDDGSTDATLEICRRIQKEDKKRWIRIFELNHGERVVARGVGIENATGEYVTFVDGDDYLAETRLENMMNAMGDCDMVSARWLCVSEEMRSDTSDTWFDRGQHQRKKIEGTMPEGIYEGEKLPIFWKYSFFSNVYPIGCMPLWTKLFKTSLVKKIYCELDTAVNWGEDAMLVHRYMVECRKISVIKDYGYYYRESNHGKRYSVDEMIISCSKAFSFYKRTFQGHTHEKLLMVGAEEYFASCLKIVLSITGETEEGKGLQWHYPHGGKFLGKKVVLYGAGNVGKAYYRYITSDAECVLTAWVDKNAKYLREVELLPVEDVNSLFTKEYDYIIVAVNRKVHYVQIREELVLKGIPEEKIVWNATRAI